MQPDEATQAANAANRHGSLLRTLDAAETAILAGLEWMPYRSDVEDEVKEKLNRSLQEVDDGLELVRRAKREVEQRILEEAKGVY